MQVHRPIDRLSNSGTTSAAPGFGVSVSTGTIPWRTPSIGAAFEAAGTPRPTCTDGIVTAGMTAIRAVHVVELRDAILALEPE